MILKSTSLCENVVVIKTTDWNRRFYLLNVIAMRLQKWIRSNYF